MPPCTRTTKCRAHTQRRFIHIVTSFTFTDDDALSKKTARPHTKTNCKYTNAFYPCTQRRLIHVLHRRLIHTQWRLLLTATPFYICTQRGLIDQNNTLNTQRQLIHTAASFPHNTALHTQKNDAYTHNGALYTRWRFHIKRERWITPKQQRRLIYTQRHCLHRVRPLTLKKR